VQASGVQAALVLSETPVLKSSREDLFELQLSQLKVPELLRSGRASCRRAEAKDLPQLVAWRYEYRQQLNGEPAGRALEQSAREEMQRGLKGESLFVLISGGDLVSMCNFNAEHGDAVQVGGVYTPAALRDQGYAQAVVGGALQFARNAGRKRAVLFTAEGNANAQAAYLSLGFSAIDRYGVILFTDDVRIE
jgi:predicted GNAT family acetyltransferase